MNTESDCYLIQDLFPRVLDSALAAAGSLGGETGCCPRRMRVRGAQVRASLLVVFSGTLCFQRNKAQLRLLLVAV